MCKIETIDRIFFSLFLADVKMSALFPTRRAGHRRLLRPLINESHLRTQLR